MEKKKVWMVLTGNGIHYIGQNNNISMEDGIQIGSVVLEKPAFAKIEILGPQDVPIAQGTELENVRGGIIVRMTLVPPIEVCGLHIGGNMYSGSVFVSEPRVVSPNGEMSVRVGFGAALGDRIMVNNPTVIFEPTQQILDAYEDFCSHTNENRISAVYYLGMIAEQKEKQGVSTSDNVGNVSGPSGPSSLN